MHSAAQSHLISILRPIHQSICWETTCLPDPCMTALQAWLSHLAYWWEQHLSFCQLYELSIPVLFLTVAVICQLGILIPSLPCLVQMLRNGRHVVGPSISSCFSGAPVMPQHCFMMLRFFLYSILAGLPIVIWWPRYNVMREELHALDLNDPLESISDSWELIQWVHIWEQMGVLYLCIPTFPFHAVPNSGLSSGWTGTLR